MTADQRTALVAELEQKPIATLLAMAIVELIEVREVFDTFFTPAPGESEPGCQHPEDRRVLGGMGTGIKFQCLECEHVEKDRP